MITTQQAYVVLGVPFGSAEEAVRIAYRRLIALWHPDRNESPEAHAKTQDLILAYRHLESIGFTPPPTGYDQAFHFEDGPRPGDYSAYAWPEDEDYYEREDYTPFRKAPDISRQIKLTLEEAAFGCVWKLQGKTSHICGVCQGSGRHGARVSCNTCFGRGYVAHPRFFYDSMRCPDCRGTGFFQESCAACQGSGRIPGQPYAFTVNIPPGVTDGAVLYARGVGGYGSDGKTRSDARLRVAVREHPIFFFDDDEMLAVDIPISVIELLRGDRIEVPTLYGVQKVAIEHDRFDYCLEGVGFPDRTGSPGPLHVYLHPKTVDASAPELAELLRRMEAILTAKDDPALAAVRTQRDELSRYRTHSENIDKEPE